MRCFIVAAVLAAAQPALAQTEDGTAPEDEDADAENRYSGFPIIAYTPETSLMMGGGLVYHFDAGAAGGDTRRSSLGGTLIFTLKGQFIVGAGPTLYLGGETWRLSGGLAAALFPNTLYEVGPDASEDSAEDFTDTRVGGEIGATRLLVGALRAGGAFVFGYSEISDVEDGGLLASGELGADGGVIVGVGPSVLWDDRDNDFAPSRGGKYGVSALLFPDAIGDYAFSVVVVEARHYREIADGHVIAGEVYADLAAGDIPFQAMPALGGQNRMRGFFQGRFRDNHMVAAQIEYRAHLWRRLGGAAFAGAGDVAHTLDGFEADRVKFAGGAGLRFALNPADRVNIRLDVGASSEGDRNVYLSLGEAF